MGNIKPGDKYGDYVILEKNTKWANTWVCQCLTCGNHRSFREKNLLDHPKCQNCKNLERMRSRYRGLIGKRKGRLVVKDYLGGTGKQAKVLVHCDCGTEMVIKAYSFSYENIFSCGCLKRETSRKNMDEIKELGFKKNAKTHVDDTSLVNLNSTLQKNSTCGVTGVSEYKPGQYRAYINLRREHFHLGIFNSIEEAAKARKKAEKLIFEPIKKGNLISNKEAKELIDRYIKNV